MIVTDKSPIPFGLKHREKGGHHIFPGEKHLVLLVLSADWVVVCCGYAGLAVSHQHVFVQPGAPPCSQHNKDMNTNS